MTGSQVDPATGNGVITIIEQNASPSKQDSYPVKNWQVRAPAPVIGWLHRQSDDGHSGSHSGRGGRRDMEVDRWIAAGRPVG